jgi:hypothetical protein
MGDCLHFEIESPYIWRQKFWYQERQPSGYKQSDGFPSCYIATPLLIRTLLCVHVSVRSLSQL